MGTSVIIRTPIPSAEQVADSLGLSPERRQFLKDLASTANLKRSPSKSRASGMVQKAGRKRAGKKAA